MTEVVKVATASGGKRKLSVESLGDPDGTPVFLLHGTPGGRFGPRPRGIVLHRLGIRLITYDRPGYADSDPLPQRKVVDAADDVKAIADYLAIEQFSVVGRSGGAPHALACAARLNDQVICAAALCSLAPYDAKGLNWQLGMAHSNVEAFENVEKDLGALIATLNARAGRVRDNSAGLIDALGPELAGQDKAVVGDTALRHIIAGIHADALKVTAEGWIEDVVALGHPWGFELSEISAPVKLWAGSDDVFSPANHTRWLAERIRGAEVEIEPSSAHFRSVEVLPKILAWIAKQADAAALRSRAGAGV